MRYAAFLAMGLLGTWSCIGDLPGANCPSEAVSFEGDVVGLIGRDCASCHSHGEYDVRLRGGIDDYDEVMRYVVPYDAGKSSFLDWAAGERGWHPASWPRGSDPRTCAALWIEEGACADCTGEDRGQPGE